MRKKMETDLNIFPYFGDLAALLYTGAKQVTKYLNHNRIIRATRRTYGGKIVPGNVEIVFTVGKPNYREREFIKLAEKAGERFPIRKIQIRWPKEKK